MLRSDKPENCVVIYLLPAKNITYDINN